MANEYTEAYRYANAIDLWNHCSYAKANGATWPDGPSGYFNRSLDATWKNLSIFELASKAKYYGTNSTFCNWQFQDASGDPVPRPSVCGGTAPNDIPYDIVNEAIKNNQDTLDALTSEYQGKDKTKLILVVVVVIVAILIVLGILWIW